MFLLIISCFNKLAVCCEFHCWLGCCVNSFLQQSSLCALTCPGNFLFARLRNNYIYPVFPQKRLDPTLSFLDAHRFHLSSRLPLSQTHENKVRYPARLSPYNPLWSTGFYHHLLRMSCLSSNVSNHLVVLFLSCWTPMKFLAKQAEAFCHWVVTNHDAFRYVQLDHLNR